MSKQLPTSPDTFQTLLEQQHNIHSLLVLRYNPRTSQANIWCRTCHNRFNARPQWFYSSRVCPTCRDDRIRTAAHTRALEKREQYRQRINLELQPRGIRMAHPFCGTQLQQKFRCEQNHTWLSTLNNIMHNNNGCPTCRKAAHTAPLQPEARPFPLPLPVKVHGLEKFLNAKPVLPVVRV